tara:strand:- start:362 stop:1030 length:669 start_codon:yes stop_codon:yes gene_type:complete
MNIINLNIFEVLDKALLIIMAKWHGFGRCKTRLAKDIGKTNASKVQSMMINHTISVAKSLQKIKLIDVSIAISGLGRKKCRRWSKELGIKKFDLQGNGCLGEKMKRQIVINKKFCTQNKIKNIIFIGTDLPDLCHLDLLSTISELKQNDLILGPSNDGGYWLIGLSEKIISKHLYFPFINIKWSKENVLKNTVDNFANTKLKYKLLNKKVDIDTIIDIEERK